MFPPARLKRCRAQFIHLNKKTVPGVVSQLSYTESELALYRLSVRLEELLGEEKGDIPEKLRADIQTFQSDFARRKFCIAVVGEFNRGKSSLLNVLLGQQILPEGVVATTATINRITYGAQPRAYIRYKDPSVSGTEVALDELAKYVTKLTEESQAAAEAIDEVVIEYPSLLGLTNVDFLDTPGMNDDLDMNECTIGRLEQADMAIVALHPSFPYSDTENQFVLSLLEKPCIGQILFVCTHMDQLDEEEQQQERILAFLRQRIPENLAKALEEKYPAEDRIFEKYHRIFDEVKLFGVSSTAAMKALKLNSTVLYQQSGFAELMQELPRLITNGRDRLILADGTAKIQALCQGCRTYLQALPGPAAAQAIALFEKKVTAAAANFWKGPAVFMQKTELFPQEDRSAACALLLQAPGRPPNSSEADALLRRAQDQLDTCAQREEHRALVHIAQKAGSVRQGLHEDLEAVFSPWPDVQQRLRPAVQEFLAPEPYRDVQAPRAGFMGSRELADEVRASFAAPDPASAVRQAVEDACQAHTLRWQDETRQKFLSREVQAGRQAQALLRQARQEFSELYPAPAAQRRRLHDLDQIQAEAAALQQRLKEHTQEK